MSRILCRWSSEDVVLWTVAEEPVLVTETEGVFRFARDMVGERLDGL